MIAATVPTGWLAACSSPLDMETQCNLVLLALTAAVSLPHLSLEGLPFLLCSQNAFLVERLFAKKLISQEMSLCSGEGWVAVLRLGGAVGPAPPSAGQQVTRFQWALLYLCFCPAVREKRACKRGGKAKSTTWGVSLNSGRRPSLFQLVIQVSLGRRWAGFCSPLVPGRQSSCWGRQPWLWGELISEQNWNNAYFQIAVCF